MTDSTTLNTLIAQYRLAGWYLVPIDPDDKAPHGRAWNRKENCLLPPGWGHGVGLAHAYSRTCAIDLDQLREALVWAQLMEGVDLQHYIDAIDAVLVVSGREDRAKLLYRLPEGLEPLPTAAVAGADGKHMIQFRCATRGGLTDQDVLPPSIHPVTGKPYVWGGRGHFWNLPELPAELLRVWQGLLDKRRTLKRTGASACAQRGPVRVEDVESALAALDPDMGRDDWVRVGMALHSTGEDLEGLFDEWSASGTKYAGAQDTGAVWDSFHGMGDGEDEVTIGSLFWAARAAGWRGNIDVEALFAVVNPEAPVDGVDFPGRASPVDHMPTYEEIKVLAETLGAGDDVHPVLTLCVPLDPVQRERIVRLVSARTSVTKGALDELLKQKTDQWRRSQGAQAIRVPEGLEEVFADFCFVAELDVFFRPSTRSYLKTDAFRHTYCHEDTEVLDLALESGRMVKVDRIEYWPGRSRLFTENGTRYVNLWTGVINRGLPGPCSLWLDHFKVLGFKEADTRHLLQWMAFTLRYPETKINHGVIVAGVEGTGKDALFFPLDAALAENATIMDATALFSDFNAEILGRKFLRINETALGGDTEAMKVENKLKPMIAAPPDKIWINQKGIARFEVRNIFNVAITTNSDHPLHISQQSRRYFAVRSVLQMEDELGDMKAEWKEYWGRYWAWMRWGNGWEQCVWHLMNEVDLDGFNPGVAPPSTEFKREIQEDSMSDLEFAIREMMERRDGVFCLPLVRAEDVLGMFATGYRTNKYLVRYGLREVPSAQALGKLAKGGKLVKVDHCTGLHRETGSRQLHRIWVLDEPKEYRALSQADRVKLYNETIEAYERRTNPGNVTRL